MAVLCNHRSIGMPDDNPEEDDWLGGYRLANPPHPGLFLQTKIIRGRGLNVGEAAVALRMLRPTLSAVLNGRAGLSPEMALRFEKAFSLSMDTLMRIQCAYDAGRMRARADEVDVLPFMPKPKPG